MFPKEIKDKIKDKWASLKLPDNKQWNEKISHQIDFMYQEDLSELYPQYLDYIQGLDKIRNTSFQDTFPEFHNILEQYNG
jgi:hypothetical protein